MTLISEAKSLYLDIQNLDEIKYQKQMRIAQICIELCDIKQGNYRESKRYPLSQFAIDSGIPRSSVKEWVDTFRRVIPIIGPQVIDSNDKWNRAKKVAATFRKKHRPTREDIKEAFECDEPSIKDEFNDYKKMARTLKVFLEKRDLDLLDRTELIYFMSQLDVASDIINDFLSAKKKDQTLALSL